MRTKSTIKNTVASMTQKYLSSILAFVSRTFFIKILGTTYLGVNSLFSDIFMMLSLMELGVGSAITYFMYKPLADNNYKEVSGLMSIYSKLYRTVGLGVGLIGLLVVPFLDFIVKADVEIPNLKLIYVLLLMNLVISYFFSYKRSIFIADQKNYVNSVNELIFNVIRHLLQILFLVITKDFIVYLIINIIITLASNIEISIKANNRYPYIKEFQSDSITLEYKKHIFSRVKAIFSHKVGTVIVFGTDNILLSVFAGINFVGVYANYTLITNFVASPLNQVFTGMLASVGNLDATESKEKSYIVFNRVFFLNFWLFGFASLCLYFLFNPFILLWLGKDFLLSSNLVTLIVINFYISGMRYSAGTFCQAKGLFWNTRFKPIFESLINLISSIILGYFYGAIGIFLGTLISLLLTSLWVEPYVLYKEWFNKSVVNYFLKYMKRTAILISTGVLIRTSINFFSLYDYSFFVLMFFVVIMTNFLFFIVFYKSEEEKYFRTLSKSIMKRRK